MPERCESAVTVRVMIVHNSYQRPGGEDMVFEAECEVLRSHGVEVTRYHVSNDEIERTPKMAAAKNAVWNSSQARKIESAIEAARPDVVHVHNTLSVISPAVFHVAKGLGCATVQTLHNHRLVCPSATLFRDGRICEDCVGKSVPWPAVRHACYRDSRSATAVVVGMLIAHRAMGTYRHKVDLFLTLSEFSRSKFIEGGIPASRLMVKPNFLKRDPGEGEGVGGYALYVGRLSSEKGLDTLLNAWEMLGDRLPLRIVGDGPLEPVVRARASTMVGVEALGSLPSDRVAEQMKGATVLLFPSECYEGLPMVIIEALATGLPVVASRLGSLEEVIRDGHDGALFRAGDVQDLIDVVLDTVSDDGELARMRRSARATYLARYTPEAGFEQLQVAYQRAMDRAAITAP